MIIQSPGEIAFTVFKIPIYWYGIVLACATLTGIIYANSLCQKFNLPKDFWIDNSPLTILIGILGARLYYCTLNYNYYIHNMSQVFDIRQGGLSIHGMLLFGIIFVYILAKIKKVNFLSLTDSTACALPLAQAIGRWGNFFNSEAFGIPTSGTWGLFIPENHRPEMYADTELFHPVFLYESIANLVIFWILFFICKKKVKSGTITLLYLIMYSVVRLILEGYRTDSVMNIGELHIAQIVSLAVIVICTGLLIFRRSN